MADLDNDSTIVVDDNRPLAVRRQRRSSVGPTLNSRKNAQIGVSHPHGIATPPQTPKRTKKVRFSDPGPALESDYASSGLTPFIRRTSLSTPRSKRRKSTPGRLWNRAGCDVEPASGTLQFAPLRQVLDGRVKRRIKRNGLSEEINIIESDKRAEARARRSEVERLRSELVLKDLEVQSMRDEQDIASQIEGESGRSITSNTTLSTKILELEREIRYLRQELHRRESDSDTIDDPSNWTMAARDPYCHDDEDDEMMITSYDDDFEDMTGNDEIMTTPTRLNTSFPSPPSTMPNTPCKSTCSMSAGIQASLSIPDPENDELKSQLQSLQAEIAKLTSAVSLNEDNAMRWGEKLSEFIPVNESPDQSTLDSALDTVLTQLALTQSHVLEHSAAFSALSNEITNLGFAASTPDEALENIARQFRQARLDLEYLTPGEVAEGFENERLLGLLVGRIRVLLEKVTDRDQSIDQYHEQELLLRQQLSDRVSVMDGMKSDLFLAGTAVHSLREEIAEKETDCERLRRALEGYRAEVSGLEALISRVEEEGRENERGLRSEMDELRARLHNEVAQHDVTKSVNEGDEMLLSELERRLGAALDAAAHVQTQLTSLTATHVAMTAERDAAVAQMAELSSSTSTAVEERDVTIAALRAGLQEGEQAHGSALALRDARVSDLRAEMERVDEALKSAHSTLRSLRRENKEVGERAERGRFVVRDMLRQLGRAEEMGRGFVDFEDVAAATIQRRASSVGEGEVVSTSRAAEGEVGVRKGGMFDAGLARRSSVAKRRRYDSGLGFLEEGEEDDTTEVEK